MPKQKSSLSGWPTDFQRTPLLDQFASTRGLDPESEWEAFQDYHLAHGSKFADWRAAWRTWCRNAAKWKAEKGRPIGFHVEVGGGKDIHRIVATSDRQPAAVRAALKDNEEAAREVASMTDEQRAEARARLRAIGDLVRQAHKDGKW